MDVDHHQHHFENAETDDSMNEHNDEARRTELYSDNVHSPENDSSLGSSLSPTKDETEPEPSLHDMLQGADEVRAAVEDEMTNGHYSPPPTEQHHFSPPPAQPPQHESSPITDVHRSDENEIEHSHKQLQAAYMANVSRQNGTGHNSTTTSLSGSAMGSPGADVLLSSEKMSEAERAEIAATFERTKGLKAVWAAKAAEEQEYQARSVPAQQQQPPKVTPTRAFGGGGGDKCVSCSKTVYAGEKRTASNGAHYHKFCFKCSVCAKTLETSNAEVAGGVLYCGTHYKTHVRDVRLQHNSFGGEKGSRRIVPASAATSSELVAAAQ